MEQRQLRERVRAIIAAEESTDWDQVRRLSSKLDEDLTADSYRGCPDVVRLYLMDDDIRERDSRYANGQLEGVKRFVETGECRDATTIPWWGCLLGLAVVAILLVWFFA